MKENIRLIQSVQRAIDMINCFNDDNSELSLSEISSMLNLNISTTHGIMNTLLANNFLGQNSRNGKYRLGLKLIEKGQLVSKYFDLKNISSPLLKTISDKYKITCTLKFLTGTKFYTFDKVFPPGTVYILGSPAIEYLPLHSSASGKLILANSSDADLKKILGFIKLESFTPKTITDKETLFGELAKIKAKGYSFEDEETELGISSIAAPVYNATHTIIGTIAVDGSSATIDLIAEEAKKDLIEAGAILSDQTNYIP